jgi:hypothetical protein
MVVDAVRSELVSARRTIPLIQFVFFIDAAQPDSPGLLAKPEK